ncbi:MAG: YihY/virulence factor BrkB family protein [Bacteroidetes bacterium]|nr:YihY/virulence factor BrkB family protein [Bacteroidota bacterium]MCW5896224.1 YihY/virulence factor BrkB family protein [Bacteroidota bacterium]
MVESVIKVVKFFLRYLETVWFYTRRIGKKLFGEDILFLASGLAFNGILTMIPLMLLTASALGMFLNSSQAAIGQLNDILDAIFPPQPFAISIKQSILAVVEDIVAYRRSIGIFGAIVLLWTATSLFDALRSVLHRIFHLKRTRGLLVSLLHDVVFVFLVFLLFVTSNVFIWMLSFLKTIGETVPALHTLTRIDLGTTLPTIVVVLLTAVMFYIVYRYIPDTKPPRLTGIIATITTTVLWVVSGKVFALYLSQFSAIGTIYGPYAFILVLLIWIYYSSIIFVIGAIVGQAYWERAKLKEAGKLRRWVDIEE